MKKIVLPLLLAITSLSACSGANGLSSEKFYRVYDYDNYRSSRTRMYTDGTTDNIQFKNGILSYSSYSNETVKGDGKRQLYSVVNYYFNSSDNMIFVSSSSIWLDVYDFKTAKDYTEERDLYRFKKPEKPKEGYFLWGEYGNGWIKCYSKDYYTTSTDDLDFVLYVTESYAKKVGISVEKYQYDGSKKGYYSIDK